MPKLYLLRCRPKIGFGGQGGCRAHYLIENGFTVRRVCRFATYPWWKGVFILKHLKLDGAPLPVAARAFSVSIIAPILRRDCRHRKYFLLLRCSSLRTHSPMVEPRGLEPLTFSLQGNCAPNCATAPYCAFAQMVRLFVG